MMRAKRFVLGSQSLSSRGFLVRIDQEKAGILGESLARVSDKVRARPMSLVKKVTHAAFNTASKQ